MKPTTATPAMKTINGKQCVRVLDLAKSWHTSTASILATGKPHHIPAKHIHRIDGYAWCDFAGLRYRVASAKQGSWISKFIREFLDAQDRAIGDDAKTDVENAEKPTDLGTAALIADARRTASLALAKAENNEKRVETLEKHMDAAESVVRSAANIAEEASEAVDRIGAAAEQKQQEAVDLAKENADIMRGEIERLTRLSDDVDKAEKKAAARHDEVMARIRQAERQQRDTAARIQTLEEQARAVDWTIAAVAMLSVAARFIRLLRRR